MLSAWNDAMSPPAENASPAPVRTIARTPSSRPRLSSTCGSSRKNVGFIAFFFSGRSIQTTATASLRSMRKTSNSLTFLRPSPTPEN